MDATSLVHEAYMRLVDARSVGWQDRAHFFAVSAQIMRRILVDGARARNSAKHGGGLQRLDHSSAVNLDKVPASGTGRAAKLCALDDALNAPSRSEIGVGLRSSSSDSLASHHPDSFHKSRHGRRVFVITTK
jgi:ECF sigma factor